MHNIEVKGLTQRYHGGVTALENVSFTAGSGVFGLLGHNGAGKTTLMRALVTVLTPSAGHIRVCGFDTQRDGEEVRRRIGYLPQELRMYPSLTVREFVSYLAELKGVRDRHAVSEALEEVELLSLSERRIGQLSGGMRRRVGIAQARVGPGGAGAFSRRTLPLCPQRAHRPSLYPYCGGCPPDLLLAGRAAAGASVLRRTGGGADGAGRWAGKMPASGPGGGIGRTAEADGRPLHRL